MQTIDLTTFIITIAILAACAVYDVKKGSIPNMLTLPFVGIGAILTAIFYPDEMIYVLIMIIALFVISLLHILGNGDIKLIMAVTALRGPISALFMVGIGSIVTFVYWYIKNPVRISTATQEGLSIFSKGGYSKLQSMSDTSDKVPFGPYLLAGFVAGEIILYFLGW